MIQTDIDTCCRLGNAPDRNIVNAGFGFASNCFKPHAAGTFQGNPFIDDFDGLRHVFIAHIIEHDDISAAGQRFFNLVQAITFDFYLCEYRRMVFRALPGVVFRESSSVTPVPAMASTYRAVKPAIPHMR